MQKITSVVVLMAGLLVAQPGFADNTALSQASLQATLQEHQAPPRLAGLIAGVLENHPRLLAAQAALDASRARLQAADQAVYNPELELDTEKTDIRTSSVQLSQTLDLGDRRGSRTAVARARLEMARATYQSQQQLLLRDLLNSLATYRTRNELAELASRGQQLMTDLLRIAEQRHRAGDLSRVELELARLAHSEALMKATNARVDAASARESLRALFGTLPGSLPPLPEALPEPVLSRPIDDLLQQLPAMRIELARVAMARQSVRLRRSERSWDPSIALRSGQEDEQNLVGVTLTLPLNIRNTFRSEVLAAEQERIEAEQSAQQARRNLLASLQTSTQRYQLLQSTWQSWRQSGRLSIERQLKLIERLWRSGDMNTTDYLVQLKQVLDTRAAGLELRGKYWQSSFDWMNETASINAWLNIRANKN